MSENAENKNQNIESENETNNAKKANDGDTLTKTPKHASNAVNGASSNTYSNPSNTKNTSNKKRNGIIGAIVVIVIVIIAVVCVVNLSQNNNNQNTQVANNNENIAGTDVPTRYIEIPAAFFDNMTGGETITYLFTGGCSNIKARPKGGYTADVTYDGYDKLLSDKRESIKNMLDNPDGELGCSSFTSCKYNDSFENIKITTTSTELQSNEQDAILKIAKQVCVYQQISDALQECNITVTSENGNELLHESYPVAWRANGSSEDANIIESIQ